MDLLSLVKVKACCVTGHTQRRSIIETDKETIEFERSGVMLASAGCCSKMNGR